MPMIPAPKEDSNLVAEFNGEAGDARGRVAPYRGCYRPRRSFPVSKHLVCSAVAAFESAPNANQRAGLSLSCGIINCVRAAAGSSYGATAGAGPRCAVRVQRRWGVGVPLFYCAQLMRPRGDGVI